MNIKFTENIPDPEEFFQLFCTTGWNKTYNLSSEELYTALEKSWFTISAYHAEKLVGFARLVADGIVHAMIFDMIVLPEYQNHGIGSKILHKLLEHCVQNRIRDIQLFSADGKLEFYLKHGFTVRPVTAPGMEIRYIYSKRS